MTFRTRFAPSPTGPLHLGHAYSALLAQDLSFRENGDFLLRIEDIDHARCRPEWESQIYDDLKWLGLWWPEPVMRQSERQSAYHKALNALWLRGLLYPCTCTRRDIAQAATAPQEGVPTHGPDGLIYPRTCAGNATFERLFPESHSLPKDAVLRLDMTLALLNSGAFHAGTGQQGTAHFIETGAGPNGETGTITFCEDDLISGVGDIVLARRDMGTSYHLSVVLDDAAQGITHVVRGEDLFEATKIHVVLQHLLGMPTPRYHHHKLIRDGLGKRLAKRDDARAISLYRSEGALPDEIRAMLGL